MLYLESFLEVMGHADLLQWFDLSRKTGVCSFIQGHKCRRLYLHEGLIVASESNEPHLLLGQFLISTGRIPPGALRASMIIQERSGARLGDVLIDQGVVSEEELRRVVVAKAEETVHGLFEWKTGAVRFVPDVKPPKNAMHVELPIQQVLLEGARRADEMDNALRVLGSPDVILHTTDRAVDEPTIASYAGRRLYESINGQRTLSELILRCRTSPYLAYTFLSRLVERGIIRAGEVDEPQPDNTERDLTDITVSELQQLVMNEQHEAALDLVEKHAIKQDGNDILSMLVARAEAGFLASAYRNKVPPDAVPRPTHGHDSNDMIDMGDLSAEEMFLLELVDGSWDVRSLVWISPLRKIEVVRGLIQLRDLGYIELHAPVHRAEKCAGTEHEIDENPEHTLKQAIDTVLQGTPQQPPGEEV